MKHVWIRNLFPSLQIYDSISNYFIKYTIQYLIVSFSSTIQIATFFRAVAKFDIVLVFYRGGVEDTRLEAKAKDTKKIRGQGQGQPFRGQNLSRPRTGMLEAKAKDRGHRRKRSPKKKRSSKIFFIRSPIHWRTQNF